MPGILDHIAKGLRLTFLPTTAEEFFALRLAARLGEPQTAAHYAILTSQRGEENLLSVFKETMASVQIGEDVGRRFQKELLRNTGKTDIPSTTLAAIAIER